MSTVFDLAAVRASLPSTRELAYLNAGTFGPLPQRTADVMRAREERDLRLGRSGPHYFPEVIAALGAAREALASLLRARVEDVALTRSTTDACHIVVKGLGIGPGDEIVTTDAEHFGMLGPLAASGAHVRLAPVARRTPEEAVAAIAELIGPRTRLVAVSHVLWSTGDRLPVEQLAGHGVPLLVDGAQSAGALALDVPALRCDFYTVSGQKWLLGPEVTGALYVHPDALERLEVALPSYLSHDGHEIDGTFTPLPSAARFDPSWMATAALEGLSASIGWLLELGEAAPARALETAVRCHDLLSERGLEVVTSRGASTLVSFVPREPAAELAPRMGERGVIVRDIPRHGWVRASIGCWTSDDDLDRLVELT